MMPAAEFDRRRKRAAKMKADGKVIAERIKKRKAREKVSKVKEKNDG
jgi:hypothetical protein